jgi:hypothetical protein
MNIHLPAPRHRWPARLVNLGVVVLALALAAATFVLSYTGVHVIALQAGVSARYARVYPATFDAVLVIACAAAVMLRDARWWARSYAWLVIVVVVGVVGAADAAHAMNVALQHRTMEGVVAATPWVLALLGFSLMLTVLRHSRAQHAPDASQSGRASGRAAELPAEQEPGRPDAAIEQGGELAGRPAPAPALPLAATSEPDATPAPDVPTPDAPGPIAAAAKDGPAADPAAAEDAAAADPAAAEDAAAADPAAAEDGPAADPAAAEADPDQGDDPTEPAVSWHDYWDGEQETAPGGEGDPPAAANADTDAPPFATAPFATVPRLNRVRSTPTPPEEDEE